MRMNRKGVTGVFPALIFVVVLICIVALFFQLQKKFEAVGRALGEPQSSLMHLNHEKNLISFFVHGAAEYALASAVENTKHAGGFSVTMQSIPKGTELTLANGSVESLVIDCAIVNSPEKPRTIARPDFFGKFTAEFNKAMDGYIAQYNVVSEVKLPSQNYELYVEGMTVLGIALRPVMIPIKRTYSPVIIGAAIWKPSFEVQLEENPFNFYTLAFEYVARIASECSYAAKPFDCAQSKSPTEWKLATAKDYKDSVLLIVQDTCYALNLPPTAQPAEQTT